MSSSSSPPEDLTATTEALASQQGTATLSRRRPQTSPQKARDSKAAKASQAGTSNAADGKDTQGQETEELKVDEEAVRELRQMSQDQAGEPKSIDADQDVDEPKTPTAASPGPASTTDEEPEELERDAAPGPSRPTSPIGQDAPGSSQSEREQDSSSKLSVPGAAEPSSSRSKDASSLSSTSIKKPLRATSLLSLKAAPTIQTSKTDDLDEEAEESGSEHSDHGETEDEEEEPEPSLKYQRLKGSLTDILKKDSVSAFVACEKFMAVGTHAGMIFVLDFQGTLVKGFKSHTASVLDLDIDSTMEFVAAAGMDGLVSISSLSSAEQYAFDFKRPMRTVSVEPHFGKRASRSFVCGGMAGALIHREKGWLGHKESVLHAGEGPVWQVRWKSNLIAWGNDKGVRVYDTNTKQKITFISPPNGQARGELYRANLLWQDDRTLVIAWADQIKIAKIKEKPMTGQSMAALGSQVPQLYVDIVKIFQLDCVVSGIAPYGTDLLLLAYLTEEDSDEDDDEEDQESSRIHRRKLGQRPELRILDPDSGEEKSSDVLPITGYERLGCNDYRLVPSAGALRKAIMMGAKKKRKTVKGQTEEDLFYVVSPRDVIMARARDENDHIDWLLEHRKYEAALTHVEAMGSQAAKQHGYDARKIGQDYLRHLVDDLQDYRRAAKASTRLLGRDAQAWEEWVFLFLERGKLGNIIDLMPIEDPVLSSLTYDMVLSQFLRDDLARLRELINSWPPEIYSTQAVALTIEDRLQTEGISGTNEEALLMEVLADLYIRNRQPGKSLPYYLRLRKAGVFQLIRENNLFMDVRDQARQLIEFEEQAEGEQSGEAVKLLVDHVHSIPVQRIVPQLEAKPRYLHDYLDALFNVDPQLVVEYSDLQVRMYADYAYDKLMAYLRAMSSYYSFEKAYRVCELHDYVPEMVFLLGRVGDNKRALNLIIERLGDVNRAIDFAKEQNDDDLWEDLLRYSESRPAFIRGLLENVGSEIDPVQLIRRIQNGLDIPGLRPALIKILQEFQLQISLLEGCLSILHQDGRVLQHDLLKGQTMASYCEVKTSHRVGEATESLCDCCGQELYYAQDTAEAASSSSYPSVVFLCRHSYHLTCLLPVANLPKRKADQMTAELLPLSMSATQMASQARVSSSALSDVSSATHRHQASTRSASFGPAIREERIAQAFKAKVAYSARLRGALRARGCPTCRSTAGGFQEVVVV